MNHIGLDVGTKNIIAAYRDKDKVRYRREINGFLTIAKDDAFVKSMLLQQKVPFLEKEDKFIALGSKAEDMAYAFGRFLRRPMENGVLSIGEDEAMKIVSATIKGIIGQLSGDTVLYYSIPAPALNKEVNVPFHQKIIQSILDSYKSEEFSLTGYPINEARSVVLSQIPDKTGVGVSLGAGMVNVSYCIFGLPIYEFSLVGSGDLIDMESARVTGNLNIDERGVERPAAFVTKSKEKIDLAGDMPTDNLMRAIYINYMILIENVAKGIAAGFKQNESKARSSKPMPIVCAGGTSSPVGFIEMFKEVFDKQDMPFEIGNITRADDPLYVVAEGCLIASEMHDG